jgi:hypothetical protein
MPKALNVIEHTADEGSSSEEDIEDEDDESNDGVPESIYPPSTLRLQQASLKIKIKGASGVAGAELARCKVRFCVVIRFCSLYVCSSLELLDSTVQCI